MSKTFPTDDLHENEHEQNDNWEWSDSFTEFIVDAIEGRSLKVCTGLRPIADVNLDIKHLGDVADSDNAEFSLTSIDTDDKRAERLRELLTDDAGPSDIYGRITTDDATQPSLYDGYACKGDMYSLPFEDNTFTTTISDPPWLNLSAEEREQLFAELVRVTKPTGVILYNATWKPEHTHTNHYQLRFRQQLDFWGGPSFAAFYRRQARTIPELFDATHYESAERYPEDSPFWSEDYNPDALSKTHNTDPKKLSTDSEYRAHCCPMCGGSRLDQLTEGHFETADGEYTTYECVNCKFRTDKSEIDTLAEHLQAAATQQNCSVSDLSTIDYTPPSVEQHLKNLEVTDNPSNETLSTDLPWAPTHHLNLITGEYDLEHTITETNLSTSEASDVLELISQYPSIQTRTDGDLTEISSTELERRFKTVARALKTSTPEQIKQNLNPTAQQTTNNTTPMEQTSLIYTPEATTPLPAPQPTRHPTHSD